MLTRDEREKDFPGLTNMVYLNTAAEGICPLSVENAIKQYVLDKRMGRAASAEMARRKDKTLDFAARLLGIKREEVNICSSTAEAYNLISAALQLKNGDEIVINDLDFPSCITPWLLEKCPATVKLWKSYAGALYTRDLKPLLSPKTRLVTASLVSYRNGFMLDLPETLECVKKSTSAIFALDATQALGHLDVNLAGPDFIVASTFKWLLSSHGGAIIGIPSKNTDRLTSFAGGWLNLENPFGPEEYTRATPLKGSKGFSTGMPNFTQIYALSASLEYLISQGVRQIQKKSLSLAEHCMKEMKKMNLQIITPDIPDRQTGIISFKTSDNDSIEDSLKRKNIHIMNFQGRMRLSIHGYNDENDIEIFLSELTQNTQALARI